MLLFLIEIVSRKTRLQICHANQEFLIWVSCRFAIFILAVRSTNLLSRRDMAFDEQSPNLVATKIGPDHDLLDDVLLKGLIIAVSRNKVCRKDEVGHGGHSRGVKLCL